jgi:hypothetical protein
MISLLVEMSTYIVIVEVLELKYGILNGVHIGHSWIGGVGYWGCLGSYT